MGRGVASKGQRDRSEPSWLNPAGEDGGGGGVRVEAEKPKRRRNELEDDLDDGPRGKKKGIQWKPLAFLMLMVLPGLAPVLFDVIDKLQYYGFLRQVPGYHLLSPSPYRACLQDYYADWAPEKLGGMDELLSKNEGRERQLFGALMRKYGKKVQFERCVPKKTDKKKDAS